MDSASRGLKEVTLVVAGELPLGPPLMSAVGETAKRDLERLKVKVLPNSKVSDATQKKGKTIIELNGGKRTLTADLFIPAFGVIPNTGFLPKEMLDNAGFVKQTSSLRVDGHKNIYVVST